MNDQRVHVRIPDADARSFAVRQLLDLIETRRTRLTSREDLMPRHFAALGLARCTRLLEAMELLTDSGCRDVAGVALRPLLEVWLASFYALYGGEEAFDVLRGAFIKQLSKLPDEHFAAAKQLVDQWDGDTPTINWEKMAADVGDLLKAAGEPAERHMADLYEVLYRGESFVSQHGGIQAVAGHLDRQGDVLLVRAERYHSDDGTGQILMGAVLLAMLAAHVFRAFGLNAAEIKALANEIAAGAGDGPLIIDD